MYTDEPITKATRIIQRDDGSEVRLVAQSYGLPGMPLSVGVDVWRRKTPGENWALCSDRPHPNWKEMSVADYVRHGRSEKFRAASHGEILKLASMIGKPMSAYPNAQ